MANKAYNFRLSPEVNDHLDFLCNVTGMTRTALITGMIETEYDRYQGNPELQKVLGKMMELKTQMESMLGSKDDTFKDDTFSNALAGSPAPKLGSCIECVNPCKDETAPDEVGLCDHFQPEK